MKKQLLALLLALPLLFTACKKDEDSSEDKDETTSAKVTATVNGSEFSATPVATYRYGIIAVTAKSSSGATILLRFKPLEGFETIAPYVCFSGNDDNAVIYMQKASDSSSFTTGSYEGASPEKNIIKLTKFDKANKTIAGTFEVKVQRATDKKVITVTGKFENVIYDDKIPPTPGKTMTAKVDGKDWKATSVVAVSSFIGVQIVGNSSNGTTIGMRVPTDVAVGTYDLSSSSDYSAQYNLTPSTFLYANEGVIKITFVDKGAKVIKGTFSFLGEESNGTNTAVVTEGSFVAVY